uniref:AAA+ ATPase domain-containing protein n=1 Tax=Kalanchoe fedtschenkoi TaxID=63787 RepID=A0A7N0TC34_KALFE
MRMASAYISQFQMTGTSLFSTYASLTGMLMLVRSMFNDLIPPELRGFIVKAFRYLFKMTSPDQLTLIVDERIGYNNNHVYEAAEAYLRTIINPAVDRLKVSKTQRQKKFTVSIEKGEEIIDTYNGTNITWRYVFEESDKDSTRSGSAKYYFQIVFEKKFKDMVLGSYLPYVMDRFEQIKSEDKVVRLYTRGGNVDDDDDNARGEWGSVRLEHPVTFDKLAMDPEQKKMITDDLDRFVSRKEFYQRIGKVWKRGYLLYGPPGTGKSSLIAAMANYLKFDIYDLEMSSIYSDSDLRRILTSTTNRSILIIEDIDCNAEVQDRELGLDLSDSRLTLSGLLNFIDGLWSSCGDERIIVFTTNHKEKIDPALLRPGRMDVHIHMSYCTPTGFKILATNYLDLNDDHPLFGEIERLIIPAKVTPAEVAEELMRSEDPAIALDGVLCLLNRKITEQQKVETKESDVQKVCKISEKEIKKVTVKNTARRKDKGNKKKKNWSTGRVF